MCRIAMISAHGSPLAQPGAGEAGGMNVYVRELSRELGQRGMVVDVFIRRTERDTPDVEPVAENVRLIRLRAGHVGSMDKVAVLNHLPEFVCQALRFAEAHGIEYQYVHSHYWLSGWVGVLLALRWGIPHLTMFHTLGLLKEWAMAESNEDPRRIEVERRVIARADALIAATMHEREAMVELYGAPPQRIHVIPLGVDHERFRPRDRAEARARLDLAPDDEVALFVGRLEPLKGPDLLLRALALLARRPRLRVLIAGGAPEEAELAGLRQLARQLGVSDRVRFLGAVPQSDLPFCYTAADVCVIPSAYESFGLVAVEALACGTPVVAPKVGGLATLVRDGENGLVVPRRNPEAFAQRLDQFLSHPELRAHLRAHARSSVARFRWGEVAERVIDLYHRLGALAQPQQLCLCHR